MDDSPRISQLTKLSQEDKKRFELEWELTGQYSRLRSGSDSHAAYGMGAWL
jgi:hypothetical protein